MNRLETLWNEVTLSTVVLVGLAGVILSRQDGSHGFSLRTRFSIVQCHTESHSSIIVNNGPRRFLGKGVVPSQGRGSERSRDVSPI